VTDRALTDLDPDLYTLYLKWEQACCAAGIRTGVSQTYRSAVEQDVDYAKGRTTEGPIITNARAGQSPHNCQDENGNPASKAFDFFIYAADGSTRLDWDASDAQWQKAIQIGKDLGLVSGGDFHGLRDYPHFELSNWAEG
jgi:peptidoglycan LD-endopeptidase CwlK